MGRRDGGRMLVAGLALLLGAAAVSSAYSADGGKKPVAAVDARVAAILERARRGPTENIGSVFVVGRQDKAAMAPIREMQGDGEWLVLRMAKGAPETYINVANITHVTFALPGSPAFRRDAFDIFGALDDEDED